MLTIFSRRELIITYDMKRQSDVRSILAQNNIDYVIKTRNVQGPSAFGGHKHGSVGSNQDYSYEYKIYVHKKDYEKATWLIR